MTIFNLKKKKNLKQTFTLYLNAQEVRTSLGVKIDFFTLKYLLYSI